MSPSGVGKIVARGIGLLLLIVGLITLLDFSIHFHQARETLVENGWIQEESVEDEDSGSSFFHDTYLVVTPVFSPIASILLIVIGLAFFVFSKRLGNLLADSSTPPPSGPPSELGSEN